ncbi:NACHT domain-containing protein [Lentzea californiensis]|uniref:NACHT domain-containing protein n=1 Tax=Lentzea californiensis TaxID=438851 RepID=UPI002165E1AD|nr:NACHT domain-containing protein [Lentzea californiensis]MCR3749906.1 putative NTPase (NACHT family) [Lentzea californiensis]
MRWLGLAVPPLLAIALGLATNLASDTFPSSFESVAWPVLAVLAVVAVWLEIARQRVAGPVSEDDRVRIAVDALAGAVKQQWTREAGLRGLHGPWVLPQPWTTTNRPVSPPAVSVLGPDRPDPRSAERVPWWRRLVRRSHAEPVGLVARGEVDELVSTVLDLPHRQVVVLGKPGGGKTVLAIQFTLALLTRRGRQRQLPVPVLLSVSSWRVGEEELLDWIRNQLRTDYPELSVDLVDDPGLIFPVLDGMDELPEALHAEAIAQIDRALRGRPLMLTCRADEYEQAVSRADAVPATALVVELGPVAVADTIAYLSAGRVDGDTRWAPVLRHLRENASGPLASALRTPLMIGLARTTTNPAELLAFDDCAGIEQSLLDRFVADVYSDTPRAQTWLRSLAVHLRQEGGYALGWWELYRMRASATRRATSIVTGLVCAVLAAVAVWLMVLPTVAGNGGALSLGAVAGVLAGVTTGWAVRARAVAEPSRVNAGIRGRRLLLAGQLSRGVVLGTAVGLGIGAIAEVTYTITFDISDPSRLGLLLGVIFGGVTGLAYGLVGWLQGPADTVRAASPRAALRADRTTKLLRLAVFGLTFGLIVALVTGVVAGPRIALIDGVGAGLLGVVVGLARGPHVWTTFLVARCLSALRGELPWRLMAFLDDAHRREVLRANGGTYQFRHSLLQDHLAGGPVETADVVAAAPAPVRRRSPARRMVLPLVVSVVAGIGLGAGLPVAGGLQTRCGVSPFDTSIRYLRVGLDSECVGVTDGSYEFSPDVAEVSRLIASENGQVRRSGEPYVRVALLAPLNEGTLSAAQVRHALEGAFIAQTRANRVNPVNAELVLANIGSRQRHWAPVIDQLARASTEDHPLVSVIGLGISTHDTHEAALRLAERGIPLVSATANAFQTNSLLRITPGNAEFAKALVAELRKRSIEPTHLITDGPRDLYVAALSESLAAAWEGRVKHYVVESTLGVRGFVEELCRSAVTLYSGRTTGLRNLLTDIALHCPNQPITVVTEAISLAEVAQEVRATRVRLIYASPVDPAGWEGDLPFTPRGFADFRARYVYWFDDSLDDGYALLHHDAALTAFTAINAHGDRPPTPAGVRQALRRVEINGATGAISFDNAGNPIGKLIPVLEFPRRSSGPVPYVTGGPK